MALVIFGIIICVILDNIRIELKYRNTLLEKQNVILAKERK